MTTSTDTTASPAEVLEVWKRLEGLPHHQVVVGCLTMAIVVQKPDIDVDDLSYLVMNVSRHVASLLLSMRGKN